MYIPFLKPPYDDAEIEAVTRVMRTANLSTGPEVNRFEREFAGYIGVEYAVAVNSGTSALELVLQALIHIGRIEHGAGVIIPSFTSVEVANAVVNAGLKPVFADISPETMNIDMDNITLQDDIPIRAIIPVHTFGLPCDMYSVVDFANKHELVVIEDCTEALGASYSGYRAGSLADCGIFSFTPTKNMTTGEGGMITTNSRDLETGSTGLVEALRLLREHGIQRRVGTDACRDAVVPGHNYRMSNILAAIGSVQLEKLEALNTNRMWNTTALNRLLMEKDLPVTLPPSSIPDHACQMYTVQLADPDERWSANLEERERVRAGLLHQGVDAKVYFNPPIHQQTYYRDNHFCCSTTGMTVTEAVAQRVITLPMYLDLSIAELKYMADSLEECINEVLG